ncbi:EamA family transporter [Cohnella nanjingensis]|uniref:EamA family transporter n=1 Tax=Cohnella nanjingensis TaxID=1387779 RepID=A0A7X0RSH9_9BACL|nr:EamA family transporter [Cohnella nanjingensis]MBB6672882.1 EamA family transporter [Cohnella nanjingensis]
MIWFATAVLSALVFGLAGLLMKVSQMRGGALSSLLLGLYAAGTCGFWLQALLAKSWQPFDGRIWLAGAVVGLGSAWGNLLFMRALDYGPASLTSPLANGNIVFVMAMGAIWFEEPVRPVALAGAAALIAGIVLLSIRTGRRAPRTIDYRRWYPLVAGATLLFVFRNGGLKVTDSLGLDSTSVLWAGYLLSWLWFAAAAGLEGRKQADGAGRAVPVGQAARTGAGPSPSLAGGRSARAIGFGWGLAAGICSYGGLQLYANALAQGPSYLVAPIFAANSLVVAVGSLLIYRERLSAPQRFALLFLLLGLVLVRL